MRDSYHVHDLRATFTPIYYAHSNHVLLTSSSVAPKAYFSYIRVSTVKQGQTGTSLDEQRGAIERFALRHNLVIAQEFEEKETAAKGGRPVFSQMLKALKHGKARGVIIHKIDRSARNLRDWAELGELIDNGVEVLFANENLDLHSRGGRLSADIQAVVAADYIRNLREEVKKGFYGRIKQGFYPMPAPVGYLDQGQGKAKVPDPVAGPLVRKMFELYASRQYSLSKVADKMHKMGLRTKYGNTFSRDAIGKCLRQPFYIGLIRIKANGELYPGAHSPLVSKVLFDKVQSILDGRAVKEPTQHNLLFRKLLRCTICQMTLIGERQKGHVYYRCHTKACPTKTVREDIVEEYIMEALKSLRFSDVENRFFQQRIEEIYKLAQTTFEAQRRALHLQLEQIQQRLSKLTDAFLDGTIEQTLYVEKKNAYVNEEKEIREQTAAVNQNQPHIMRQAEQFLELVNNAYLSYKMANPEQKRKLIETTTSNLTVNGKTVLVMLRFPFQVVADRMNTLGGGPSRATPRTVSALLSQLAQYFKDCQVITHLV